MDPKLPVMESSLESSTTVEASRSCDTSLMVEVVMVNPTPLRTTHEDIEDIKEKL